MLHETLRILAFCLLICVIIMDDFPIYNKMKDSVTQFFLALCVVLFIYFDPTFGLIMGFVLLMIYFEIYGKIKKNINGNKNVKNAMPEIGSNVWDNEQSKIDSCVTQMEYITDEHLFSAQNNIFDEDNMKKEITVIENNKKGCSTQGFSCDKSNIEGYCDTVSFYAIEESKSK